MPQETKASLISAGAAPVERNFAIHHVGDIPAFGKKLHNFMTCAGQFRPARSGSRVLFEATYFLAVEGEVHLAQPVLGGAADRKVPAVEAHFLAALNQTLPPNGNQCLFQIHLPILCRPAVTPSAPGGLSQSCSIYVTLPASGILSRHAHGQTKDLSHAPAIR